MEKSLAPGFDKILDQALPKMKEETWYLLPHAYSLHFEYLDELALSYQRKIDSIIWIEINV